MQIHSGLEVVWGSKLGYSHLRTALGKSALLGGGFGGKRPPCNVLGKSCIRRVSGASDGAEGSFGKVRTASQKPAEGGM